MFHRWLDVIPDRCQCGRMSIDVTADLTLARRVAAEIRAEMGRKQISGRTLATRLGRSPNWVSLKVSGAQKLDLDELALIASVLGVTVIDLFPRKDRETTEPYVPFDGPTAPHRPTVHGDRPFSPRHDGRPANRGGTSGPGRTSRVRHAVAA